MAYYDDWDDPDSGWWLVIAIGMVLGVLSLIVGAVSTVLAFFSHLLVPGHYLWHSICWFVAIWAWIAWRFLGPAPHQRG